MSDKEKKNEEVSQDELLTEEQTAKTEQAETSSEEQIKELNDKYLRLYSEFDNYRKRTTKERVELTKTASENVILSLLPILDDFERAQKAMETAPEAAPFIEGWDLIHSKLKKTLEQRGLKVFEPLKEVFDDNLHEAIAQIPAGSEAEKGNIIEVVEKGYYLCDKIIRFPKVVVAI